MTGVRRNEGGTRDQIDEQQWQNTLATPRKKLRISKDSKIGSDSKARKAEATINPPIAANN